RRARCRLDRYVHGLAERRELERIVEQIGDDLVDACAVGVDPDRCRLQRDLVALEAPPDAPHIDQPCRRLGEIEALAVERELAVRDAADVEEIADQPRHMPRLSLDGSATFSTCAAAVSAASGLRSSWLSIARNSSLARLAACTSSTCRAEAPAATSAPCSSASSRTACSSTCGCSPRASLPAAWASAESGVEMRRPTISAAANPSRIASAAPVASSARVLLSGASATDLAMPSEVVQPLNDERACTR